MQDAEDTADLHFLWKDRKRGDLYEGPAAAETAVFLQSSEMTRENGVLFYLLPGIGRPTNRKRAVYKCYGGNVWNGSKKSLRCTQEKMEN